MKDFLEEYEESIEIFGILVQDISRDLKKGSLVKAFYDGRRLCINIDPKYNYIIAVKKEKLHEYINVLPDNKITRRLYGSNSISQ